MHGCADELEALLRELGYDVRWDEADGRRWPTVRAPEGRKAVFVGDLVDRGPRTPDVLRIAMAMTEASSAYVVNGNHDWKLARWMAGRAVTISHGLEDSIASWNGRTTASAPRSGGSWTACQATSGSMADGSPSPTPGSRRR